MASEAKITANRRNARKSTGPRTNEGKGRSRMNAIRHGLTADETLIAGEDFSEYAGFFREMLDHFEPDGPLESSLVERITIALWRLKRVTKLEAGMFALGRAQIKQDRLLSDERSLQAEIIEDNPKQHSRDIEHENDPQVVERRRALKIRKFRREELPTLGLTFVRDSIGSNAFTKLSRYEAHIERTLYRSLHELQRLQTARLGGATPMPIAIDVTQDTDSDL